ncbi:MAG: hypothetical protein H6732_14765 [Alphaproteobacteria bacterium]|nr:hypothetical protein [Alphaproteobacteria bacterium]
MWLLPALGLAAWAAPTPMVEVHGLGVLEAPGTEAMQGAGGGVVLGLRAWKPLWGELLIDASWLDEAPAAGLAGTLPLRLGVAGQLRAFLTPRDSRHAAVSVALGLGLDVLPTPTLLAHGSAALDVYVHRDVGLRLEAGYLGHPISGGGPRLALGVVWSPRKPEPEPEPEPAPLLPWQLFPVCAWTDEEGAMAAIAEREAAREAALRGEDAAALAADAAAPGGGLLVLALPGDVVRVSDGATLPTDGEGVALLRAPAAIVELEVVGGGRVARIPAQLVDGHATWLRAPPPEERRALFELGSAVLVGDALAEVQAWAARTGGWTWRLHGSFSPEGDAVGNHALAKQRAHAVAEALLAAGVPAAQVVEADPEEPDPSLTPEAQRAVRMVPVPARGDR